MSVGTEERGAIRSLGRRVMVVAIGVVVGRVGTRLEGPGGVGVSKVKVSWAEWKEKEIRIISEWSALEQPHSCRPYEP